MLLSPRKDIERKKKITGRLDAWLLFRQRNTAEFIKQEEISALPPTPEKTNGAVLKHVDINEIFSMNLKYFFKKLWPGYFSFSFSS